jgi:hypothetical protein
VSEKSLFAFRLRRFLALAPSLFRRDAVFRYAVIGGGLALFALLSRLGDAPAPVSAPVPVPASALPPVAQSLSAPVPPPASLGTEYGAAPESKRPPEPVSHAPPRIAPSHSLDELGAAQNPRPAPDRFGVIPRASPEKN